MHLSIFCPPGPVFYNGAFDAPSRLKGGDLDKKWLSPGWEFRPQTFEDVKFPWVSPPGRAKNDRCIRGSRPTWCKVSMP